METGVRVIESPKAGDLLKVRNRHADAVVNALYGEGIGSAVPEDKQTGELVIAGQKLISYLFPESKNILVSSDLVYRPWPSEKDEDCEVDPSTPLGESMLTAEKLADSSALIVRTGIPLGHCAPNLLDRWALKSVQWYPRNGRKRAFVLNRDLSLALMSLLDKSGVYNVCDFNMYEEDFADYTGIEADATEHDPADYSLSCNRLTRETGLRPSGPDVVLWNDDTI